MLFAFNSVITESTSLGECNTILSAHTKYKHLDSIALAHRLILRSFYNSSEINSAPVSTRVLTFCIPIQVRKNLDYLKYQSKISVENSS